MSRQDDYPMDVEVPVNTSAAAGGGGGGGPRTSSITEGDRSLKKSLGWCCPRPEVKLSTWDPENEKQWNVSLFCFFRFFPFTLKNILSSFSSKSNSSRI